MKSILIIVVLVINGSQTSMTSVTESLHNMQSCQTVLSIVEKELTDNAQVAIQGSSTKIVPLVAKCVRVE